MKSKAELGPIIQQIVSADSPVGIDAVYVHALILETLSEIEARLGELANAVEDLREDS